MAIIPDAGAVIQGEKGTFDLKGWVMSRPNDRFEIAAITVAELWHGVEFNSTRPSQINVLHRVLNCYLYFIFTDDTDNVCGLAPRREVGLKNHTQRLPR